MQLKLLLHFNVTSYYYISYYNTRYCLLCNYRIIQLSDVSVTFMFLMNCIIFNPLLVRKLLMAHKVYTCNLNIPLSFLLFSARFKIFFTWGEIIRYLTIGLRVRSLRVDNTPIDSSERRGRKRRCTRVAESCTRSRTASPFL